MPFPCIASATTSGAGIASAKHTIVQGINRSGSKILKEVDRSGGERNSHILFSQEKKASLSVEFFKIFPESAPEARATSTEALILTQYLNRYN